jgi:hypothetical protein
MRARPPARVTGAPGKGGGRPAAVTNGMGRPTHLTAAGRGRVWATGLHPKRLCFMGSIAAEAVMVRLS